MAATTSNLLFERISALEIPVCRFCHQRTNRAAMRFFALLSRVGDGHYLYAILAALLWIDGWVALPAIGRALVVIVVAHFSYRALKRGTARLRPFELFGDLAPPVRALDRYSFPSGHTLHAVAFTWVITAHYAFLGFLLIPFALLIGLSRVVLGLHFPTDVAAGAALGSAIACLVLAV